MTLRRQLLAHVAAPVAIFALGYWSGRFSAPSKVVTRTVTQVQTKVQYRDRIVTKTVTVQAQQERKQKVVYIDRTITKEGAVHEVEKIVYRDRTDARTQITQARTQTVAGISTQTSHSETQTVVEHEASRWLLSIGAGAAMGLSPFRASPVYEVDVHYRPKLPLNLPITAGLWATYAQATSTAAVGVGVGVQF